MGADMKKNRAGKLIGIFLVMLKIGLFTFGGGYAMIALLENEFVTKKKWIGKDEFLDMIAIAESTPGPAAVNSATYLGYRVGGFPGAFLGTLAVCIPSFIIIYVISLFFDAFLSIKYVGYGSKIASADMDGKAINCFNERLVSLCGIKAVPRNEKRRAEHGALRRVSRVYGGFFAFCGQFLLCVLHTYCRCGRRFCLPRRKAA